MSIVCRFGFAFTIPPRRGDLIRTAIFLSHWLERPELDEIRLLVDWKIFRKVRLAGGPETPTMKEFSDDDRLYLDDLHIGQRFTSGTHVVDEEQIKAFLTSRWKLSALYSQVDIPLS
jgi:hypothetical protein